MKPGRLLLRLLKLLLVCGLVALLLALVFPERIVERAAHEGLRRNGQPQARLRVCSVGLTSLVLEQVSLDDLPGRPSAERVEVRYTPRELLRRRLRELKVVGLRATLDPAAMPAPGAGGALPSWSIDTVIVEDATLAVTQPGLKVEARCTAEFGLNGDGASGTLKMDVPAWSASAGMTGGFHTASLPACDIQYEVVVEDLAAMEPLLLHVAERVPRLRGLRLGGRLAVVGDLRRFSQPLDGRAKLHLQDGWIEKTSSFEARGIQTDLEFLALAPLTTAPRQAVRAASLTAGPLSGALDARLDMAGGRVQVESLSLDGSGGMIRTDPFVVDTAAPSVATTLHAERLDLGRLFALQKVLPGVAEGHLGGQIKVLFRPGELPQAAGFLTTPPGEAGRLRIDDASALTRQLDGAEPRLREVERALRDFTAEVVRLDVEADRGPDLSLRVRLEGRAASDATLPPVRLNATFAIDRNDLRALAQGLSEAGGGTR